METIHLRLIGTLPLMQPRVFACADGWAGVPSSSLRNACIDVCLMDGIPVKRSKMRLFGSPDGLDCVSGEPLIKMDAPDPEQFELTLTNPSGATIHRVLPVWREWELNARILFDANQLSAEDVEHLIAKAGQQCGLGERCSFSKFISGNGLGRFRIAK